MAKTKDRSVLIENRRARHEYFVEETLEAGLVLFGTEVKSLRQGRANLQDSYIALQDGEAFVIGFHISPYEQGNIFNRDPMREKKLLLHKSEIRHLDQATRRDGYTLVPLKVYFSGNRAKMLVGVCKGKKLYDKRATIKQRDDQREMDRAFRNAGKQ